MMTLVLRWWVEEENNYDTADMGEMGCEDDDDNHDDDDDNDEVNNENEKRHQVGFTVIAFIRPPFAINNRAGRSTT